MRNLFKIGRDKYVLHESGGLFYEKRRSMIDISGTIIFRNTLNFIQEEEIKQNKDKDFSGLI